MGLRGKPVRPRHLEQLDLAGRGVDAADGGALVGDVAGEPEIAGQIEPGIVDAPAWDQNRRRAQRPVAAVVLHEVGGQVGIGIERNVVFLEHHARRFARRPRLEFDAHVACAGAARLREIGGKLLLVIIENAGWLALAADEGAVDIGVLHQFDDGVPAGLVEAMLQREARGVAAGADRAHDALHAAFFRRALRQGVEHQIAGKLLERRFRIAHRREREILLAICRQIDRVFGGLITERLRPDPIAAVGQSRKKEIAGTVGEHRRGDGAAVGLRRHRDAAHGLAVGRFDGAAQQRVGEGRHRYQDRGDGGEVCDDETAAHGVLHLSSRHRATSRL